MDISKNIRERSTVFMAIMTLLFVGSSLLVSTWQIMQHQKKAEEQHIYLSTRSVMLAIESSLLRGITKLSANSTSLKVQKLFNAMEQDGEILFATIINHTGNSILTSESEKKIPMKIPSEVIESLFNEGQWHGWMNVNGSKSYVYGKKITLLQPKYLMLYESPQPPIFLLVGLDSEHFLSPYSGFRKNIIFQAVYIIVAALSCWTFAFSFLSRRETVRRANFLEQFQAKLLNNIPEGLLTLDTSDIVKSVNPAAKKIFSDVTDGVLVDKHISQLPKVVVEAIHNIKTNNQTGWQRIQLNEMMLEVMSVPIVEDNKTSDLVIVRDRTKLSKLEHSLAEAEKLAVIGTLAAGIAHEVRNPLSSLRGFAQYFVKKLSGCYPEEEYARTMVIEADRLNRVITDLLFLAKPKKIARQSINLIQMVQSIELLLKFDLEQKNITILTNIKESTVYADPDALKQSLLNLLLNSLDAITEGNKEPIVISSTKENDGVCIKVQDKGCGMTKEQATQAFEPFFTSKANGTGLGLALVSRAMLDHGGNATAISTLGKGCIIKLFFPDENMQ